MLSSPLTMALRRDMMLVCTRLGDLLGNNVAALKALMSIIGHDLGPPRSPLRPPSDVQLTTFKNELDAIGFFQWNK